MNDIFRIVKIIDDETVVINAGEKKGIKIGDKFQIYSVGEAVIDPETEEILGTLNTVKENVVAIDVFENMTICRNRKEVGGPLIFSGINFTSYKNEKLNVDISEITGGLSDDKVIKIGDKVRFLKNESAKD